MSESKVGGLVAKWRERAQELAKPRGYVGEYALGAATSLERCATQLEAALSAHGQPVVDEAMVERAMDAFASVRVDPNSDTLDHDLMRAALTAALTGATP